MTPAPQGSTVDDERTADEWERIAREYAGQSLRSGFGTHGRHSPGKAIDDVAEALRGGERVTPEPPRRPI